MRYYLKNKAESVLVADKPFASGGEGELYEVMDGGQYRNHVAKVYHLRKRGGQREAKIQFLLDNPPQFEQGNHRSIVWVEALLYDADGDFVGFIMPRAQGEKLEILCAPKLPRYLGADWQRLDFEHDDALKLRAKVCYNIAVALHTIHATNKYVLVDLKPDNVILQSNGLISVVDMDSIEVMENGKTLFPATVATPEYTPPEYYEGVQPGKASIDDSWDRFGVAVIFYRLLLGIHPFAASCRPPYDGYASLGDKIEHGFFVHNPDKAEHFSVVPYLHKKFFHLDETLQTLFYRTFIHGHLNPKARTSAREWGEAFYNSALLLVDRRLPSQLVAKAGVENSQQNLYRTTINAAVEELLPQTKPMVVEEKDANKLLLAPSLWDVAQPVYQKVWQVLAPIVKFGAITAAIVLAFVLIVSVTAGGLSLGAAIALPVRIFSMLFVAFSFFTFKVPVIPIVAALPLVWAAWKKSKTWALQDSDGWGEKFRKNMNLPKLKRFLENKQYQLFTRRTEHKQKLQELRSQMNLLLQLRNNKEQTFYQKNKHLLQQNQQKIDEKIKRNVELLAQCDQQARQLFVQEADAIKQLRQQFQNRLENEPRFADIPGKTWQEKCQRIGEWKTRQMGTLIEVEQAAIALLNDLQLLQNDLELQSKNIRAQFESMHAQLADRARQINQQIVLTQQSAANDFRRESKLDALLRHPDYKKLLDMQNLLQSDIQREEKLLQELNKGINEIRGELMKYRD